MNRPTTSIVEKPTRRAWQWSMLLVLPVVAIGGHFVPWLGFVVPVMILTQLSLATLRGRLYCGWVCGMGALLERVRLELNRPRQKPELRGVILHSARPGKPQRAAVAVRLK